MGETAPLDGTCKMQDTAQMFKVTKQNPMCSFSGTEVVEANPEMPLGNWLDLKMSVYLCK